MLSPRIPPQKELATTGITKSHNSIILIIPTTKFVLNKLIFDKF